MSTMRRRILDDRNRELLFGPAPSRIVSLVPSDTLSVAELGAAESLVGCTKYCELPSEVVAKLPKVGGTKKLDLDAIRALEPDLILANQEENTKADLEALAESGLRVFVSFPVRAQQAIAHAARLAQILRREREPEVVALFRRAYQELGQPAKARAIRVFCPIWKKPLMTAYEDTYLADIVRAAGGELVIERKLGSANDDDFVAPEIGIDGKPQRTRYPEVSLEEVARAKPELVLLPSEPYPFSERDIEMFSGLGARVVLCDGKDLCWSGTHTIRALPRLRNLLQQQT